MLCLCCSVYAKSSTELVRTPYKGNLVAIVHTHLLKPAVLFLVFPLKKKTFVFKTKLQSYCRSSVTNWHPRVHKVILLIEWYAPETIQFSSPLFESKFEIIALFLFLNAKCNKTLEDVRDIRLWTPPSRILLINLAAYLWLSRVI